MPLPPRSLPAPPRPSRSRREDPSSLSTHMSHSQPVLLSSLLRMLSQLRLRLLLQPTQRILRAMSTTPALAAFDAVIITHPAPSTLDAAAAKVLARAAETVALKKGGSLVLIHPHESLPARVAVVALEDAIPAETKTAAPATNDIDSKQEDIRKAAAQGFVALKANGGSSKKIGLVGFEENPRSAAEGAILGSYVYDGRKKDTDAADFAFVSENAEAKKEWEKGSIYAQAQNVARDLANAPANLLTPTVFSQRVEKLFSGIDKTQVIVHDRQWAQERNMGLFLGVTNGSDEEPKFLEIHYKGAKNAADAPIVFVGKGVTFDSGGISIKPSANMAAMKADMMGAASVISAGYAIAKLGLEVNLVVLTPLCENMPNGRATKPGDVHVASNGTTVEVDNTDAEGRLILSDALIYADEFKPHTVIDVATLTGAMVVALGTAYIGAFARSDELWTQIHQAGVETGDEFWRMPLSKKYEDLLKSNVADLINIGGPKGGSCSAAAFLGRFVSAPRWAHLDIAGVMDSAASTGYAVKGMTGNSTRGLVRLVENISKTA
eukprot:TRINITY_DN1526_c0_g1_i1.p1 TRINITY_DN1526_c0_g1~~TRINITY_DN1526_c0_g1_i1.p1  ORF type:complete len:550 (-),score=265.83 TRINITY_DN1526_c0_g1_i1:54-1703(-)